MKFNLTKFLGIVNALAPVVLLAVPGGAVIAPIVPVIVNAITEAEQISGASGPEKKAHVLNIVDAAVVTANATGKVHINPTEAADAASHGIDAVIGAVAVIEGAKVVKPPKS